MSANGRWDYCLTCKEPIWLAPDREQMLRRSNQNFYCLWGHAQHFTAGPSEADKLRQERDRLKQNEAFLEEQLRFARDGKDRAERRASAARGQVTRLKNRAAAGVCPCCNRSFKNLRRHMASKHKGFALEETAPIGATVQ